MQRNEWKIDVRVPTGHTYFRNTTTGEIAVADHSIRRPWDPSSTDDGLLTVDTKCTANVMGGTLYVPVKKPDDKGQYHVIERMLDSADLIRLLNSNGVKINLPPAWCYLVRAIVDINTSIPA